MVSICWARSAGGTTIGDGEARGGRGAAGGAGTALGGNGGAGGDGQGAGIYIAAPGSLTLTGGLTIGNRAFAGAGGLGAAVGGAAALYRIIMGLGLTTNLDDQYPWGIWIALDVATGVALAAGGALLHGSLLRAGGD